MTANRILAEQVGRDLWVVMLCGEHDLASKPDLVAALDGLESADVVVDLAEATFIDSSIAGELVKRILAPGDRSGRLAVTAPPGGFPHRVLSILGLEVVLPVYESRDDAIRGLGRTLGRPVP